MTRDKFLPSAGFFTTLTRLILLANALSGVLRVNGALAQQDLLLELGLPAWLPTYLLAVGGLSALLSFFALVCTWLQGWPRVPALWVALLFPMLSY